MKEIVSLWGINNEEVFASMQLMRPYKASKPVSEALTPDEIMGMQLRMKDDVRKLMKEADKFPQELLFVNRNMNLVRSVNKKCGSLVNRINVMARYASKGCDT
jgi:aarF domain-containing kinase